MNTSQHSHNPMLTQTHPHDKTLKEVSTTTCGPRLCTIEPWASHINRKIPNRRLPSTQYISKGLCDLGLKSKPFLMMTFWTTSVYSCHDGWITQAKLLYSRYHTGRKTIWFDLNMQKEKLTRKPQHPMLHFKPQTHSHMTSSVASRSCSYWVLSVSQFPRPIKQNYSWEERQAGQTNHVKCVTFYCYVFMCPDPDWNISSQQLY